MDSPTRRATLLETVAGPVHVIVHADASATARDTAVILLPQFGLDDLHSYRPRRDWADTLAADGYLAVRVSYPGAGDSGGGPGDPDLLDTWTTAVTEVAAWVRSHLDRPRVALIAVELGGLIACRAIDHGLTVDDLVLWAAPATGRQLLRRLQAFSNLEATADDDTPDPVAHDSDGLVAGGYRLSAQTVAALRALDVAGLRGLEERIGRVALLGRDQLTPDSRLRGHLAERGLALTRLEGNGYSAMTAPTFEAVTPQATIRAIGAWLDAGSGLDGDASVVAAGVAALSPGPVAVPLSDGSAIRETQLRLRGPGGELSGVLAEPAADAEQPASDLCLVFLDTGTIRRIGPNRLWVEAARRWARQGVRSVRFDMNGMGDSDGDPTPYRDLSRLYDPWIVGQATSVIEQLATAGHGERFLVAGLSAGAYWSLHAALEDPRVRAVAMFNPGVIVWDPGQSPLGDFRTMRQIARTRTISLATVRKALGPRGLALIVWLLRAAVTRVRPRSAATPLLISHEDEVRQAVEELRGLDARRLLLFCDDEPLLNELMALGLMDDLRATDGLTIARIASGDHTIRPPWAQRELHAALDRLVAAERGA